MRGLRPLSRGAAVFAVVQPTRFPWVRNPQAEFSIISGELKTIRVFFVRISIF